MIDKTGGPAFPLPSHTKRWNDVEKCYDQDEGMTLRDYFAAHALHSFNVLDIDDERDLPEQMAVFAYRLADAMLKAREQ